MNRSIEAGGIAAPVANYAHAVLSEQPQRILHTSGVVPIAPDGSVPASVGEQATVVWGNIEAILGDADMAVGDIASVTTYAVGGVDLQAVMAARDSALGGHLAASTLVTVPALARPEWLVEISIVAVV